MCSVDIAGRTKMNRLWKYARLRILHQHRVEEGLGAFGLSMVDEQPDVVQLDLFPQRVVGGEVDADAPVVAIEAFGGLDHPAVVEIDAVARDVLDRAPVPVLEVPACGARALPEQRVMTIEAVENRLRDRPRVLRQRSLAGGEGGGGDRHGMAVVTSDDNLAASVRSGRAGHGALPALPTMLRPHPLLSAAILWGAFVPAQAQVYKCIEPGGATSYQQAPCRAGQQGGSLEIRTDNGSSSSARQRQGTTAPPSKPNGPPR